ncbi:MAG: polysaccharide deacetylase [Clostridiales bacterium]|nr:polysaccharide deacetylase [Clostridiales bacterium]
MGDKNLEAKKTPRKQKRDVAIRNMTKIIIIEGLVLATLIIIFCALKLSKARRSGEKEQQVMAVISPTPDPNVTPTMTPEQKEDQEQKKQVKYLKYAAKMAAGYDYDGAIEYLKSYGDDYLKLDKFTAAIADYEAKKAACVKFGAYDSATEVNHIFFHSLIYDTEKAFKAHEANGYNYYMTTISEFKEMMQQMYDAGYVLVSIHDVVKPVTREDGTTGYAEGDIMLPPDKKPFVLSQDDVNYYTYMEGDGFATRAAIDENGKPSTEIIEADGTSKIGDFDLVPVLERFIEEHPDFSYKGARGIICLTGYEGTLGYRTDPGSKDSKTYEQDKKTVQKIAEVMKKYGWEFACHSNGHRDMGECTQAFLEKDTKSWLADVGSLVGETDLYVYPFGIDIQAGIKPYSNAKYEYLKASGFHIFCGVEAKPWMQIKPDYVRMQRRPLDGQAMLMYPERLADLFDLSKVIDPSRPKLQ